MIHNESKLFENGDVQNHIKVMATNQGFKFYYMK